MAHTAKRDLAARRTLRGFGPPQPSGILRDPRSRRRSILRIAAISKLGSKAGEEALWPIGPACLSIRNAAAYAIARSHRAKTFRPTIELIERTSELGGTHARYFRAPCDHRSLAPREPRRGEPGGWWAAPGQGAPPNQSAILDGSAAASSTVLGSDADTVRRWVEHAYEHPATGRTSGSDAQTDHSRVFGGARD